MITITKTTIENWQEYEGHPDIEITSDYDLGQFGHTYSFFKIQDLAYWDALCAYDPRDKRVVACLSQVISADEATEIINKHLQTENILAI